MANSITSRWEKINDGQNVQAAVLAICLSGLEGMDNNEQNVIQTRTHFSEILESIARRRDAIVRGSDETFYVIFKPENADHENASEEPDDFDIIASTAITIFEAMPVFNNDPIMGSRVDDVLQVSIVGHFGKYEFRTTDAPPSGPAIDFIELRQQTLSKLGSVVLTARVASRITRRDSRLRDRFREPENYSRSESGDVDVVVYNEVDFCVRSQLFPKKYEESIHRKDGSGDSSDLWIFYLHSDHFGQCQVAVTEHLKAHCNPDGIRDISLHSLLGRYELLGAFRAENDKAVELAIDLARHFKANSLVESKDDFLVLNVMKEEARVPANGRQTTGSDSKFGFDCLQMCSCPDELLPGESSRTAKGFISLEYQGDGDIEKTWRDQVLKCAHERSDIVERICTSARGSLELPTDIDDLPVSFQQKERITLELMIPCGKLGSFFKLSAELEKVLEKLKKQTHVGYRTVHPGLETSGVHTSATGAASTGEDYGVFINYNSDDRAYAMEIAERLKDASFVVYIDGWLTDGLRWREQLEEIMKSVPKFIVLVGPTGPGDFQRDEITLCYNQATKRKVPLIPVLLPGATKDQITDGLIGAFQCIDLSKGITEASLKKLVESMRTG